MTTKHKSMRRPPPPPRQGGIEVWTNKTNPNERVVVLVTEAEPGGEMAPYMVLRSRAQFDEFVRLLSKAAVEAWAKEETP